MYSLLQQEEKEKREKEKVNVQETQPHAVMLQNKAKTSTPCIKEGRTKWPHAISRIRSSYGYCAAESRNGECGEYRFR